MKETLDTWQVINSFSCSLPFLFLSTDARFLFLHRMHPLFPKETSQGLIQVIHPAQDQERNVALCNRSECAFL